MIANLSFRKFWNVFGYTYRCWVYLKWLEPEYFRFQFSSFGGDTLDFAHWVPLSQNWNLQYETLSVSDLESYRFFILKMLKLYMPGYADMWNWSWSVHSELLHIKNMRYNAHDVFHWLHSKIGMPFKTPLVDLLSINLLTCFDRKSFSACYENEDVKESSQSIKVVISLASTIVCLYVWVHVWRSENNLQKSPFFLCDVGSGNQTHVIRFCVKNIFHLLCYFAVPRTNF